MTQSTGTPARTPADKSELASVPSVILDSLQEGVCGVDLEGRITFANRAATELTFWPREELYGERFHDLLYHSLRDGSPRLLRESPIHRTLMDGQVHSEEEDIFWRRDESFFPTAYTATPIQIDDRVTGAVITFRDLTQQEESLQEIRQQEERHRALLEALPDAIIRLRLDGEILELRIPSRYDVAEASEITGRKLHDIVGDELAELALLHARRAVESGELQQFDYSTPSEYGQEIREARLVAVGPNEVVAVVRDITATRRSDQALLKSEQRFRAIFNLMYQFIGLLQPDGTVLEINEAALRFAGISTGDVVGRPFWETPWWQASADVKLRLKDAIKRAAAGEFVRYEVEVLGANEQTATIDFSLKPVLDEQGDVILLIPEGRDITEHKRSELALRHSQQLLTGITNSSTDGIMALRAVRDETGVIRDFRWLFANPRSAEFTGAAAASLDDVRVLRVMPGGRGRDLFEQCVRVVESGEVDDRELYYEEAGDERYFRSIAVRLGDGCVITVRNVTEERMQEQRLRANQLQMKRAQEIAHLGNWEWDPQTGELLWSDELYHIYGLQVGAPTSFERYLAMVHPDDREHVMRQVQEAVAQRESFSFEERIVRQDGAERTLLSSGEVMLDDDGYMLVMGVCLDITDMRHAEQQLRESEQRFRQLAEQMTDLVTVQESDGRFLYVSPSAERILGLTPPDLVGRTPWDFMHPDDIRRIRASEGAALKHVPDGAVARLRHRLGHWVWLEYLTTIVASDDGDVFSYQSSARDVTERVEAQQAAARSSAALAQRNRELQDFAYVASHDLQEPLRKIRAFADLLRDDYAQNLDEEGQFYLDRVQDSAHRMSTLISDLLMFSRVSTRMKPHERVDLNQIADDVISDLEYLIRDVDGSVEVEPLPIIEADATQMRQLLQNLIGNALKFRKPDQPPVVSLVGKLKHEALHHGADEQDLLEISVSDNGIGFDEKYLSRIFTPFQRLHTRAEVEGTGMGLAICRRIVERHGGTISASSRPGVGSSFIVRLPIKRS